MTWQDKAAELWRGGASWKIIVDKLKTDFSGEHPKPR